MAGRTVGIGNYKQGILIAINADLSQMEEMTAAFTLCPKPLAAARKEGHLAGFAGVIKRLPVHMADHQHCAIARIDNNRRQQPVCIKFRIEQQPIFTIVRHPLRLAEGSNAGNAVMPPNFASHRATRGRQSPKSRL